MPTDTAAASPRVMTLRTTTLLGIGLAVLGAALFATKGIVIKLAMAEGIDPVTTLAWRMIVAVPIFLTVGLLSYRRQQRTAPAQARPLTRKLLFQAAGVGVLNYYLASLLDFSSLAYISAQLDRLILLTYPFFVVLFGAMFFSRKVTPTMGAALLIGYLGIVLIFAHDFAVEGDNVLLGSALVFGAALIYAAYNIMAKPLIDQMGAQFFTSVAMSAAGPAVVLHFLLGHPISALAIDGHGLLLMLAIGTISTVLPAYCISGAIGLVGPERTAIIGNVSPIVTAGLAVGVLGEAFTFWHAAGTALVLFGVWLFGRKARPKAPEVDVEP